MDDITDRLLKAADRLDHMYEGSKHIPTDLVHDRDFRVGLVRTQQQEVAQFFWGGAAEVFLTLPPSVLPILSALLRSEAEGFAIGRPANFNASALANHILNVEMD